MTTTEPKEKVDFYKGTMNQLNDDISLILL